MSIEQKIEDLTAAIRELTAAYAGAPRVVDANIQTGTKPPKAEKPKEEPKAEKPKEEPKAEKPKEETLDYASYIQKPALNLVAVKGRDALTTLLREFGVGNAKEVPEPKWPALRAAIDAATNAQEDQV